MTLDSMEERDIIITAFACGGKMKCRKEADKFAEPPLILNVPGGSSAGFAKTAQAFRAKHSVLDNFLATHVDLKKIKPRRVCIVSFSDGWTWTTHVLRAKKDRSRIDTVIVMDGIHTPSLSAWFDYATLAAEGGSNKPKLWMAHTQIKPSSVVSAKKTNRKIINTARERVGGSKGREIPLPDYIWYAQLENPPISIYSKIEKPRRKLYHTDPLKTFGHVGNAARFEYEGGKAQDHIYNAHYVQPRFWQWLRELWADPKVGVRFTS